MIKKNLLILLDDYLPLSQTFVYDQIVELDKYYDCSIGTLKRTRKDPPPNVKINIIKENKTIKYFRTRLRQRGIFYGFLHKSINNNLSKLIEEIKPDGILVHFGDTAVLFQDSICASQLPVFVYYHGFDASGMIGFSGTYRKKTITLLNNPSVFPIIVSHGLKKIFQNHIEIASKCWVHYLGIPLNKIPIATLESSKDDKNIIIVARLVLKKGHAILFHAFSNLVKYKECNYTLDIVGDGPERENLMKLSKNLKISKYLHFHGSKPIDWVYQKLSKSDVFVLPSITKDGNTEGLPISILEAMASNIPIVATRHSGIPEVFLEENVGLLVKENDVQGLSDALVKVSSNYVIGKSNRKIVESHFNIKNQVQELANFFDKIINA